MPRIPPDKTFPARESDSNFEFEYARPLSEGAREAKRAARGPLAKKRAGRKKSSRKRRGTVSPLGVTGRSAGQAPRGRDRSRKEIPGPAPLDVSVDLTKLGPSAEVARKQAVSAALLKGAAFVEPSEWSGVLRGLLSGWGIGLEIDAAMQQYRDRKRTAAESARAQKIAAGPPQRPPTRANYGYSMQEIA
jgi:hypothetical protein